MLKDSLQTLAETSPRIFFQNFHAAAARIRELESLLGLPASAPRFGVRQANGRVAELEALLASKTTSAAPVAPAAAVIPSAPVAAAPAAPVVVKTGRERFSAAVAATAKPQVQRNTSLHGRDRFAAAARVDGTPQVLPANKKPSAAGLKGRARFSAAVAVKK